MRMKRLERGREEERKREGGWKNGEMKGMERRRKVEGTV